MKKIHTIVIGAGSGGLTVAIGLARTGKKVALIEKSPHLGGECTNSGCIPSKALIHAAKTKLGRDSFRYVWSIINQIREEESPAALEKQGVTVLKGTASFVSKDEIDVTSTDGHTQTITADHIVISTGSSPQIIDIPGLPNEKLHTNETIFSINEIPKTLIVIGAGPVGCELAMAFAQLGSTVHIVYRGTGILKNEDPEAQKIILKSMDRHGIVFHWEAEEYKYEHNSFTYKTPKRTGTIANPDAVLLALGRVPNINDLNLDHIGIKYDKIGIETNESNQTNINSIYAIGDVTQSPKFTHVANAQGRHVVQSIAFPYLPLNKLPAIPAATFTSPEVASIGLSVAALSTINKRLIRKIVIPLNSIDRAKTDNIKEGAIIIHAQTLTGKILRATIVAPSAGEMIPYFIIAMETGTSLWKLFSIMLPYPTLNLAAKKAADEYVGTTLKNIRKEIADFIIGSVSSYIKSYGLKTLAVLFWLALLIGVRIYMNQNNLSFLELSQELRSFITSSSSGPLIYILFAAARPLILFPASLITILAGSVFGLRDGFTYALIGGTISSVFPYAAGRFLAGKPTEKKSTGLLKYAGFIKNNPFQSVLILRFLYMPYDAVSFIAGSVRANFSGFMLATFMGNIAGTLSYAAIGASVEGMSPSGTPTINPQTLLLSFALLIAGLIISRLLKSKKILEKNRVI